MDLQYELAPRRLPFISLATTATSLVAITATTDMGQQEKVSADHTASGAPKRATLNGRGQTFGRLVPQ